MAHGPHNEVEGKPTETRISELNRSPMAGRDGKAAAMI